MINLRGHYTPLTISETVFVALPDHAKTAWLGVQAVQARWAVAREELPVLEQAVTSALSADEQAADTAVRAGKPIPKPTAPAAEAAVEAKRREIPALARLCDEHERDFLDLVHNDADDLADTFMEATDVALMRVNDAIGTLIDAVDDVALFRGAWDWTRSDMTRAPQTARLTATYAGTQQEIKALCEWLSDSIHRYDPRAVVAREREQAAVMAAANTTGDGVLLDRAAATETADY